MNRYKVKSVLNILLLGVIASVAAIGCKNKPSAVDQYGEVQLEVETLVLEKDSTLILKSYPASIEGKNNVEIRPQISGYIDRILVDEGQYVKSGTTLFRINVGTLTQDKNQAVAALSTAKSQLVNAQLDLEKYQNLADSKVMTDFNYRKAKAVYDAAKSLVVQQEALIESINVNLSYATVKAPVDGYVGRLPKKLGALVSPVDVDPMTTISDVNQIYVYFSLSENDILAINKTTSEGSLQEKLRSFDQVNLQLADGSNYPLKGKIDMLDGQYNAETASITVRASFPNPEHILRSGNTGRITLESIEYDVFKIPVLATFELQDRVIVGKLNEKNEVEYVPLKDFTKSGDYYIVKSSFSDADRIVAKELARIPEKSIVTIKSKK